MSSKITVNPLFEGFDRAKPRPVVEADPGPAPPDRRNALAGALSGRPAGRDFDADALAGYIEADYQINRRGHRNPNPVY